MNGPRSMNADYKPDNTGKVSVLSLLIAAAVFISLWAIMARLVNQPVLPKPIKVFNTFSIEIRKDLGLHLLVSLYRVLASILLAIVLAAPAGLLLAQYPRLNQTFSPLIYLLYPVPKVVLVPIVLLLLGVGDLPKIIIIALILFFQILVLVRDAALNIHPELILSVRSLGAGRRALLRYVYLPASVPAILTSIRQSIGTAIAVLYIAELFDYPKMYAGIFAMGLLGIGLYFVVDALEQRLCKWRTGGINNR
jgi:ABC-type nitrate/sulfonate/bicarbonate transport system permease component